MSAYAHQMEREFSGLSSRGNSELGSQYVIESGFYMKSFTATIFVASLVTVGVLMLTLLVTLSVMLQTCKNTNARTAEAHTTIEDINYCKILALHVELNGLGAEEFPIRCRDVAIRYVEEGAFFKDLNFSIRLAESYFESFKPLEDGRDLVLMEIDHILQQHIPLISALFGNGCIIREAEEQKRRLTLELFLMLRSRGFSMALLSRKSERHRNFTAQLLISAGYSGWTSLIMRPDTETQEDRREYFSKQRVALTERGFKIAGVIGNHMDVLTGPCLGTRVFKLPNSLFYHSENFDETKTTVIS